LAPLFAVVLWVMCQSCLFVKASKLRKAQSQGAEALHVSRARSL
jgi:hypothetical protein